MKCVSGGTVSATVIAPGTCSVILVPHNSIGTSPVMANLLCTGANVASQGKEAVSLTESPPPVLERYADNDEEIYTLVDRFDPYTVYSNEFEGESSNHSAEKQEEATTEEVICEPESPKIRRSQRKSIPSSRPDIPYGPKDCAAPSTSTADMSPPPAKRSRSGSPTVSARVGLQYQADVCPMSCWVQPDNSTRDEEADRDVCIWMNDHNRIDANELQEFYQVCRQQFGLNPAHMLEIIYRSNYNMAVAMERIEEVVPEHEQPYTAEEQDAFQKYLSSHGKNFKRMQKVIPSRSVSSLVNYYYKTKRAKCFGVQSNEPCPHLLTLCDDDAPVIARWECDNCILRSYQTTYTRRRTRFCAICDLYYRRYKKCRPFTVPLKSCRAAPDSLDKVGKVIGNENSTLLPYMISPPQPSCSASSSSTLKSKEKPPNHCSFTSPRLKSLRWSGFWTEDEKMNAFKHFYFFGKNYDCGFPTMGEAKKSPEMLRQFYERYQARYRLDSIMGRCGKPLSNEDGSLGGGSVTKGVPKAEEDQKIPEEMPTTRRSPKDESGVGKRVTTRHKNGGALLNDA